MHAAQRSYDLTSERYRAGLDNYLSVLSSQNQVLLRRRCAVELQARRLTYSVDLVQRARGRLWRARRRRRADPTASQTMSTK